MKILLKERYTKLSGALSSVVKSENGPCHRDTSNIQGHAKEDSTHDDSAMVQFAPF